MPPRRRHLTLGPEERQELEQWARLPPPSSRARRARILLLLAGGRSTRDICAEVGCAAQTVKAWRLRYESGGLASLRRARHTPRKPLSPTFSSLVRPTLPGDSARGIIRPAEE